jgi:hypothetical protein
MPVKIAGLWDLAWNTPIKEIDLWKYPLKDFGVETHYMVPVTGIKRKIEERDDIQDVLDENPDYTVIFCDERATTTLKDFKHPPKALYIFGKANFSPFLSLKRDKDLELRIETAHPRGGLLWGHQAAAIILYDRFMKEATWQ